MTQPLNRHKAFAMVTAIFLMSFVTITVTVLMTGITSDARRTQTLSQDAQLRQLLLAGAQIAQSQLPDSITTASTLPVALPDSLQKAGATLTIKIQSPKSPSDASVEIEATLPHRRLAENVHFIRETAEWKITSAALNE